MWSYFKSPAARQQILFLWSHPLLDVESGETLLPYFNTKTIQLIRKTPLLHGNWLHTLENDTEILGQQHYYAYQKFPGIHLYSCKELVSKCHDVIWCCGPAVNLTQVPQNRQSEEAKAKKLMSYSTQLSPCNLP